MPLHLHVGTTAGTVAAGDDSRITGALSAAEATSTYAPLVAYFDKADRYGSAAIAVTGAGAAQVKSGTVVQVEAILVAYATATTVTMPTLTAGEDYRVYAVTDGTAVAVQADGSAPASSRLIGGFHYAPGGNAPNAVGTSTVGGGNTTPAINPCSVWDLTWRPKCNPRAMTKIPGLPVWSDIYLMHRSYGCDGGWSRYASAIADGAETASTPLRPTIFGGDGSTRIGTFNAYDTAELAASGGKRLPSLWECSHCAFGVREKVSLGGSYDGLAAGTDFVTGLAVTGSQYFTSACGVIQATGCMWTRTSDWGGPFGAASWSDTPGARGQHYNVPNVAIAGGFWGAGANSGSRASGWYFSSAGSATGVGGRGVCDHLSPVI